ncbi:MAG: Gfo/Idh/MocA family oxidoreductase [Deltaproteobacteria bacterium]|nr:Gfo/Idh/MocA family oxidoreductase [Deltaproteobacteria bacterium]
MNELQIVVVGAGHMGRRHAQKVAALAEAGAPVRLAGVIDIIEHRAADLGRKLGVPYASNAASNAASNTAVDARELIARADAAIVAVSTIGHYEVVKSALLANCDVLVEKPIAATLEEGEELIALAGERGRILQVGHLEWFNNAMRVIRDRIHRPRFIEAHRMGPYSHRESDIDVVRDLMIHDLEILHRLVGEEPDRIEAVGISVLSDNADIANARLTFPGGCVANLTASRVSLTPMRRLRFFQSDGYFVIDFLEQTAVVIRREVPHETASAELDVEKIEVDRGDALLDQLQHFIDAVRTGSKPVVDGAEGLGALRTAVRINQAMPDLDDDYDIDYDTDHDTDHGTDQDTDQHADHDQEFEA